MTTLRSFFFSALLCFMALQAHGQVQTPLYPSVYAYVGYTDAEGTTEAGVRSWQPAPWPGSQAGLQLRWPLTPRLSALTGAEVVFRGFALESLESTPAFPPYVAFSTLYTTFNLGAMVLVWPQSAEQKFNLGFFADLRYSPQRSEPTSNTIRSVIQDSAFVWELSNAQQLPAWSGQLGTELSYAIPKVPLLVFLRGGYTFGQAPVHAAQITWSPLPDETGTTQAYIHNAGWFVNMGLNLPLFQWSYRGIQKGA